MKNSKFFRDPVHNYIEIPTKYCTDFIDSYLFQRLRAIEQTSIRCLYPAARHDRFIHSIGTYHLASKIFLNIEPEIRKALHRKDIEYIKHTFLLAALLHDCAHSPFSHTGEEITKTYCNDDIKDNLIKLFSSDFEKDITEFEPAPHEMASAYVACVYFKSKLKEYKVDIEQLARMITGVLNTKPITKKKMVFNALIKLLNGFIIDCDRLDYLLRDSWASGVNNATVDIERLIKGITLDNSPNYVKIKSSALSSLINAVKARDFIFQWILPHHKVSYFNHVLREAITELIDELAKHSNQDRKTIGNILFSPDRLLNPIKVNDEFIYMPTDGDIIYLMKKYTSKLKYTNILLTRASAYKPLWKSIAEFFTLFPIPEDIHKEELDDFYKFFHGKIKQMLPKAYITYLARVKTTINALANTIITSKPSLQTHTHCTRLSLANTIITSKPSLIIDLKQLLDTPPILPPYFFVYIKNANDPDPYIKRLKDSLPKILQQYQKTLSKKNHR